MHHWTGHMVVYPLTWNMGTLLPPVLTPCGGMHPTGILSSFYYVTLPNQEIYHENLSTLILGNFIFLSTAALIILSLGNCTKYSNSVALILVIDCLVTEWIQNSLIFYSQFTSN